MGRLPTLRILPREQDDIEQMRHALELAPERVANLELALIHSRDIGAAIGILMATRQLRPDEAFDLIRATSQNCNRKVRDIALDVMEQRCLPAYPQGMPEQKQGPPIA